MKYIGVFIIIILLNITFVIAASKELRDSIVDIAVDQKEANKPNKPYVRGKYGPDSFDCSGLVNYSYRTAATMRNVEFKGFDISNHGPRAADLYGMSERIEIEDTTTENLLPGDLLFEWNEKKTEIGHVGVYIGIDANNTGQVIEAASPKLGIIQRPLSRWLYKQGVDNPMFYASGRIKSEYWPNSDNGYTAEENIENDKEIQNKSFFEKCKNKISKITNSVKNFPKTVKTKIANYATKKTEEVSETLEKKSSEKIEKIGDNFEEKAEGICAAQAAYANTDNEDLEAFREFRDKKLLTNKIGTKFVNQYYQINPQVAEHISKHNLTRKMIKILFFEPVANLLR